MDPVEERFFPYYCDACNARFCERVQIMNLALGAVEEQFCIACLAAREESLPRELAERLYTYIQGRDCFRDPWQKAALLAAACPLLQAEECYCQGENALLPPLDLRDTPCPLNFVKTKLALEKLSPGDRLDVIIRTDGESAINIPTSIVQEGHTIVMRSLQAEGIEMLRIQKA